MLPFGFGGSTFATGLALGAAFGAALGAGFAAGFAADTAEGLPDAFGDGAATYHGRCVARSRYGLGFSRRGHASFARY